MSKPAATPDADLPADPNPSAEPEASDATTPPGIWAGWVRPLLVLLLIITALRSSLVDWNDVPTGSMNPTILEGDRIVVNKLAYGFNLPFNGPAIQIPLTAKLLPNPLDFLPGFYWSGPKRNDIVTFWKPPVDHDGFPVQGRGMRMVKRVVGVPGDTVAMEDGQLIINGQRARYVRTGSGVSETLLGDTRPVQYETLPPGQAIEPAREPLPAGILRVPPSQRERAAQIYRSHLADLQDRRNFSITLGDDEYLMIGDNRDNSLDGRYFGPVHRKQITGKAKFIAVSFDDGITNPQWSRWFRGFNAD